MPKMRGIKAETWTDDKFVELTPLARLLFIGMWNYACDNGHIQNKPSQLKMRILPADDCTVTELVDEILAVGMATLRDGYLSIPNLPLHQRIDKRYFTACDHCAPHEIPESHDGRTTGARRATTEPTPGSRVEGRKEGEGTEGDGEGTTPAAPKPSSKSAKGTGLPDDFRPSAKHITLADELGVNLRFEWQQFRDHHLAKGSTFKSWDSALNTWIRNAAKFAGKGAAPLRLASGEPIFTIAPDDRR